MKELFFAILMIALIIAPAIKGAHKSIATK